MARFAERCVPPDQPFLTGSKDGNTRPCRSPMITATQRHDTCSSLPTRSALNRDRSAAYAQGMAYLLIAALIGGLLMYLLCSNGKATRIGEMLLFSSILALLIALAPATIAKLH